MILPAIVLANNADLKVIINNVPPVIKNITLVPQNSVKVIVKVSDNNTANDIVSVTTDLTIDNIYIGRIFLNGMGDEDESTAIFQGIYSSVTKLGNYSLTAIATDSKNEKDNETIKMRIECLSDKNCSSAQYCDTKNYTCKYAFNVNCVINSKCYKENQDGLIFVCYNKTHDSRFYNTSLLIYSSTISKKINSILCFPSPFLFDRFGCFYSFKLSGGNYMVDALVNGITIKKNITSFEVKNKCFSDALLNSG